MLVNELDSYDVPACVPPAVPTAIPATGDAADPGANLVSGSRRRHIADLIEHIKESADKLAADGSSRGDLKLLSRAIRELQYAFKVFSPYRRHRHRSADGGHPAADVGVFGRAG